MAGKGVEYWEHLWDDMAKKADPRVPGSNRYNLFIIDKMLMRYSTLPFTTYGKAMTDCYKWSKGSTFASRSKSQIVVDNGFTHTVYPWNEPNKAYRFHCKLDTPSAKAATIQEGDVTIHNYEVFGNYNTALTSTAISAKCPIYKELMKNSYPDVLTVIGRLKAEAIKNKPIYQDGDLHQMLQAISKKTNVSMAEMGFTVVPKPSVFECVFAWFPWSQPKSKKESVIVKQNNKSNNAS